MSIGRFIAGIAALVWDPAQGRYLLLRRAATKDFGAGAWECVTGRVEQGEGFEDAVRREVREELGVEVAIEYLLGTSHFYRGAAVPENELLGVVCLCSLQDPMTIHISDEHSEQCWVSLEEAAELLKSTDGSTLWLSRVLQRAAALRSLTSPLLADYFRQHGIELA